MADNVRIKELLGYIKGGRIVNSVKEFKGFEAPQVAVGENDQGIHVEQVSVATWKDGKILHERFYYDTGNA